MTNQQKPVSTNPNPRYTSEEWLAELERLRAEATPGPWRTGWAMWRCTSHEFPHPGPPHCNRDELSWNNERQFSGYVTTEDGRTEVVMGSCDFGQTTSHADARYIAAACNAVPQLIARIRELEKLVSTES